MLVLASDAKLSSVLPVDELFNTVPSSSPVLRCSIKYHQRVPLSGIVAAPTFLRELTVATIKVYRRMGYGTKNSGAASNGPTAKIGPDVSDFVSDFAGRHRPLTVFIGCFPVFYKIVAEIAVI